MQIKPKDHISLGRPIEISLGPRYRCPVCGNLLWIERSPRTYWQEWLYTEDDKRHYKTKCNLAKDR